LYCCAVVVISEIVNIVFNIFKYVEIWPKVCPK
jgi:hypothetical protein